MNLLLCHERFRFRYGVDRVLLLLAREFRARGHRVALLGTEIDDASARAVDFVRRIPPAPSSFASDVHTVRWLEQNESIWFPHAAAERSATEDAVSSFRPDVVITAGWHFLSAMAFFAQRGARVIYSDHGIIPTAALPEYGKRTVAILRELKGTFLPWADGVIAVSDFVRETEFSERVEKVPTVTVIENGVDHAGLDLWSGEGKGSTTMESGGRPRILLLGRFEPHTYKQSELVFTLEARIRAWAPEASIGALATPEELRAAAPATSGVVALGRPADAELAQLIRASDLAVGFSKWEGFNLPLAEAQAVGRPCLVFPTGAHPAVVAHPWLLCRDLDEMDEKIRAWTEQRAPVELLDGRAFAEYVARRRWTDRAREYLEFIEALPPRQSLRPVSLVSPSQASSAFFLIDVTNACVDPSNSGCVRVTRRLAAEMQVHHPIAFIVWDRGAGAFRFPTDAEWRQLGAFQGPVVPGGHASSETDRPALLEPWLAALPIKPRWLLLPEIRHREDLHPILDFAARSGLRTAAIFHDAIPLQRPELISDPVYREGHFDYMVGLARCDVNVANSHASEAALRAFWQQQGLAGRSHTCLLPGGFPGERPAPASNDERGFGGQKFMLCVSTVEPRKNQRRLIEAFLRVRRARPELDWGLVLVGRGLYWSGDLADWIREQAREHPAVRWLGVVDDDRLADLYGRSEFTVYPSEIEGFGLPILESMWYGRPCLCHADGVMAELAAAGGCMTANLTDPTAFDAALLRLMTDADRREQLAREARERPIKQWPDYAAEFLSLLSTVYWSELAPATELPAT